MDPSRTSEDVGKRTDLCLRKGAYDERDLD